MKKPKTIFDLIEEEQIKNDKISVMESTFFSKDEEEHNDEGKESHIGSSLNYFNDSKLNQEDYFMEESDLDDKSSFASKNEKDSNSFINNSTFKESEFIKLSRLGNGSYGQVFKIKHKETNKIYALKEINKSKLIKENKYYQIIIENDMLKSCSHPNIVNYYGFYENKINFSIIEEYCPYGDLSSFICENKQNLSLIEIQYIIGEIIICLEYLSTKKIVHRDIKPENFLITNNFKLKLIDFGTATFLGEIFDTETNKFVDDNCKNPKIPSDSFIDSHKFFEEQQPISYNAVYSSFKYKIPDNFQLLSYPFPENEKNNSISKFEDIKRQKFVGTAEYMAPEIINSKRIGYYTDMWSLICILYLSFTGHTPFSEKTEYLIFQNITHVKYDENNIKLIPKEALDLIKNFFKIKPSERLGYIDEENFDFNKIKSHPFFILKDDNLNLSQIKEQLTNKCSYYKNYIEKKNKKIKNTNIIEEINKKENDSEESDCNGKMIKSGLLKKQSPYFYYDLRKVVLYDTPRIDYMDPETFVLKGTINLNKKCSAQLLKANQFKLITPKRTYIFMCKERYDISPWVSAINKAIKDFSS